MLAVFLVIVLFFVVLALLEWVDYRKFKRDGKIRSGEINDNW